jgi:hypothetical protein
MSEQAKRAKKARLSAIAAAGLDLGGHHRRFGGKTLSAKLIF